jgi:hypothetical protein
MFSDGLIEAAAGGSRSAGIEELVRAAVEFRPLPLDRCVESIAGAIRDAKGAVEDDLLLLGVDATCP